MNTNDKIDLIEELSIALKDFNWEMSESITGHLITGLDQGRFVLTSNEIKNVFKILRRKRRYREITRLGEAVFWTSEGVNPSVRRHYAQALIDQGMLEPGRLMAESILTETVGVPPSELAEAAGLIGRIYKQAWIDHGPVAAEAAHASFERAFAAYFEPYKQDPVEKYWHGINCVAILKKAERDGLSLVGKPDPGEIAGQIIQAVQSLEAKCESADCWLIATHLEALIALERFEDAETKALEYLTCPDADAFEIQSTLRQLKDVWGLRADEGNGRHIISLLNAALLRREGGSVSFSAQRFAQERRNISEADKRFEKIFNDNRAKTLHWYLNGLKRCDAIARIEALDGKGLGTGWILDPMEFELPGGGPQLLITNAHVLSEYGPDRGLPPEMLQANFQLLRRTVSFGRIVRSSDQDDLDFTIVELADNVDARHVPIMPLPVVMAEPPPRVYVIGHPGGRDLEFSIHDNRMLAVNEKLLHYRAPTEAGSSGSPVFDHESWRVVALHHGGCEELPRLDGTGTYEANEGISILEIRRLVAAK
jgi:hypothetical protein